MENVPDWAILLRTLYEGQQNTVRHRDDPHDETVITRDDLYDGTDLNYAEIDDALSYMVTAGLIDTEIGSEEYVLTPRGFEVAHQRRMQARQEKQEDRRIQSQNNVNSAIGFLTLGLLLATYADTALAILFDIGVSQWVIMIGLATDALVVFTVAVLLIRTGLLDPDPRVTDTEK